MCVDELANQFLHTSSYTMKFFTTFSHFFRMGVVLQTRKYMVQLDTYSFDLIIRRFVVVFRHQIFIHQIYQQSSIRCSQLTGVVKFLEYSSATIFFQIFDNFLQMKYQNQNPYQLDCVMRIPHKWGYVTFHLSLLQTSFSSNGNASSKFLTTNSRKKWLQPPNLLIRSATSLESMRIFLWSRTITDTSSALIPCSVKTIIRNYALKLRFV